jgi:SpoVK/Ycf46/Vps4 family AAA+-type ATPase
LLLIEHLERIITAVQTILAAAARTDGEMPYSASFAMTFCNQVLRDDTQRAEASGEGLPDLIFGHQYGLTSAELFMLWVVIAQQLDPEMRPLLRAVLPRDANLEVNVLLLMKLFCDGRGDAVQLQASLSPQGRLIKGGLLRRVSRGLNSLDDALVAHEQVVHCFCGVRAVSVSAAGVTAWERPSLTLDALAAAPRVREMVPLIERFQSRTPLSTLPVLDASGLGFAPGMIFMVMGPPGSGRTTTVKALAGTLRRCVLVVDSNLLAALPAREAAQIIEDVCFESELYGDLLCLRDASALVERDSKLAPVFAHALQRRSVLVLLCVQSFEGDRVAATLDPFVLFRCRVSESTSAEVGARLWQTNIPMSHMALQDVSLSTLSQRVTLTPLQVRKATSLAYLMGDVAPIKRKKAASKRALAIQAEPESEMVGASAALLERAAKEQISKSIGAMATVSEPTLALDDLILGDEIRNQILEVIAAGRHRRHVLRDWGVGLRITRGTGIVVLLDGEPGTGKTHAAEVIASELGLSLVRVNISAIVDKYIGETEKNLTEIFSHSRPDTSLLLFDEADSLFSKRSADVSKSTDRYSNMNINVLLQLIERYEGITVLTTNIKRAIDPAFERRFTYKIHIDLPDAEQRERLWRYLLPESVRVGEAINYEWLSEVDLSGGEIKNAIMLACYRAVREGHLLDNECLHEAARREAAASGRMVRS